LENGETPKKKKKKIKEEPVEEHPKVNDTGETNGDAVSTESAKKKKKKKNKAGDED
jgi:hypothetical protein